MTMIANTKGMKPEDLRQTACVAAALYADLKLNGAEVGTFAKFFAEHVNDGSIRKTDAQVEDLDKIVGSYIINGEKAARVRVSDFDQFEKMVEQGLINTGMVRIKTDPKNPDYGHNMNVYYQNDSLYVSDVGRSKNHGRLYDTLIKRKNFKYFEYIK
jgi:hypothetical protein